MEQNKIMKCFIGDIVLCDKAYAAKTLWERTKGLMFRKSIGPTDPIDGMMIYFCNSVHTFFMRFPLDLLFLDNSNKVIKVIHNKKTWRMTWFYFKATRVLELPIGMAENIKEHDVIEVEYV